MDESAFAADHSDPLQVVYTLPSSLHPYHGAPQDKNFGPVIALLEEHIALLRVQEWIVAFTMAWAEAVPVVHAFELTFDANRKGYPYRMAIRLSASAEVLCMHEGHDFFVSARGVRVEEDADNQVPLRFFSKQMEEIPESFAAKDMFNFLEQSFRPRTLLEWRAQVLNLIPKEKRSHIERAFLEEETDPATGASGFPRL